MTIFWDSVQGLGHGFLFLVLVIAAMISETIDRRLQPSSLMVHYRSCVLVVRIDALSPDSLGLKPAYAEGWLAAAVILYTARWWAGGGEATATPQRVKEVAAVAVATHTL